MSFEQDIVGELPLAEAAAYFLRLKTAAPGLPPDESGALEGQFSAPVEQVLQVMSVLVENEFKTMYAYKAYAQALRDLNHFSIAEEFEEHSEQEIEHADFLMRRMAVLGGPPQLSDIPAPPPASAPEEIIQTMIRMEQEGIQKWQLLHQLCGENPTKYKIEEFLTVEQTHLDELWQLMPHEANRPVLQPHAQTTPAAPQEATPPTNTPNASGGGEAPATEKKEAMVKTAVVSMKLAAAHQRIMRKKATGNLDNRGEASQLMNDFLKTAAPAGAAKALGAVNPNGLSLGHRSEIRGVFGEPKFMPKGPEPISPVATGPARGIYRKPANALVNLTDSKKTAMPFWMKLAGIGGSYDWKQMAPAPMTAADPMQQVQPQQAIQVTMPTIGDYPGKQQGGSAAAPILPKARGGGGQAPDELGLGDMGLGKLSSKKSDLDNELYGDVISRILGQSVGAMPGRKKKASVLDKLKLAFEDGMNVLGDHQALEQAQVANEARFYQERARQAQQAQQQLQESLATAQAEAEQQKAEMEQLHQTVQQQTATSNEATTKALMQTVQAHNEALQSRQLANQGSMELQKLKQTLVELGGETGFGTGPGAGGDAPTSPAQQGPAGQAPGPGSAPNAAPPAGETQTPAPSESPESGASGQPGRVVGQQDINRPQTGDQFKRAAADMGLLDTGLEAAKEVGKKIAPKLPYALGGAAAMGGAHALGLGGSKKLEKKIDDAEAAPEPTASGGSFANAMSMAQMKARLAFARASEEHPVASTAAAAIGGAGLGASLGPGLVKHIKQAPSDIRSLLGR